MSAFLECDDQPEAAKSKILLPPNYQGTAASAGRRWGLERGCIILLACLATLFALYAARTVAFPMVLGFLIAAPLRPIMRGFRRLHVPQFLAAALVLGSCAGIVAVGIYGLSTPASEWLTAAPQKLHALEQKLRSIRAPLEEINRATEQVEEMTTADQSDEALKVSVQQPGLSSSLFTATGDVLIGAVISITLAFLLLVFGDRLLESLIAQLPSHSNPDLVRTTCTELETAVSQYLLTYTVINVGLGTVIGTGLWWMGMPNPALWGVMAGLLNFIPFLGLVVGSLVVTLVALLSFDSTSYALLAPAIYLVANGLEANLVTPCMLGRSMRLNTIMIFVFIVTWGWLWGVGGAIIAVPILATLKICCERFKRLQGVAEVLSA